MKMSEEMAVKLHQMMWSDMRKKLRDTPDASARNRFKEKWCETHFPEETISYACFLCEYADHTIGTTGCNKCPIKWPYNRCSSAFGQPPAEIDYRFAPISKILALPTRNPDIVVDDCIANDEAVKHYAKEQNELIFKKLFKELAEASGLDGPCRTVSEHVSAIQKKAAKNQRVADINVLQSISGLSYLTVGGFGNALKAKIEEACVLKDLLNKYKDRLSVVSGLSRDRPIDIYLNKIYDDGFTVGKETAKEEMLKNLKKIEEVLMS